MNAWWAWFVLCAVITNCLQWLWNKHPGATPPFTKTYTQSRPLAQQKTWELSGRFFIHSHPFHPLYKKPGHLSTWYIYQLLNLRLEVKDSTLGREHPTFMQNLTDPRLSTFTDRSPATFLRNTQFFVRQIWNIHTFLLGGTSPKKSSQHLFHEVGCINIVSTNGFCHIVFTAKDSWFRNLGLFRKPYKFAPPKKYKNKNTYAQKTLRFQTGKRTNQSQKTHRIWGFQWKKATSRFFAGAWISEDPISHPRRPHLQTPSELHRWEPNWRKECVFVVK